jgi:hypothetical protein
MNAIFWLHVGQSGKNTGTVFEDTLGMSALSKYQFCGFPFLQQAYDE